MERRSGYPLSPTFCNRIKDSGRYGDGRGGFGLYLRVWIRKNGRVGKTWAQRIRIGGRVTSLGLGSYPGVTLKEARRRALANAQAVEEGRDPRSGRMPTFSALAEKVIAVHAKSWKPGSALPQSWRASFRDHAAGIADKPVSEVSRQDVLAIVEPLWHTKPAAARSVLQRVGTVLRYAVATGLCPRNVADPAAIRAALPGNGTGHKHHAAVPHADVSAVLAKMRAGNSQPCVQLALEFLVLTAARPGEALGATWDEIDLQARMWTIPAGRMKAKREHRVPLSGRALGVLSEARTLSSGEGLVFPSAVTGGQISSRALGNAVRRAGADGTVHGFRSSFRDWCAETGVDRAVAEASLAHVVGGVEGAYRRTDFLEQRRKVGEDWDRYVAGQG